MSALSRVRDFAAKGKGRELCGLCAEPVAEPHPHVVEPATGRLHCACAGCAAVFAHSSGKFRRVGDRVARLADFRMSDAEWEAFGVPVGIAFFRAGRGAFYPGPLGAVESELPAEAWAALVRNNPALASLDADVEALLVRRGVRTEACIVPIDRCYALVGLIRREWRGFGGGDAVQAAVDGFFGELA